MRVWGLGFEVGFQGFVFEGSGFGFRVSGLGFGVEGLGFRVWRFRVWGAGVGFWG